MTEVKRRTISRIDSLQVLRLVAAVLVVIGHTQTEIIKRTGTETAWWQSRLLDWGLGVDVFFVLSGFIMIHMMLDRFGSRATAVDFLRRRLIRIAPLYWIFTTVVLLLDLMTTGLPVSPLNLIFSYLFLPGPQCGDYCFPLLTLGWTLNCEMLFYAIFTVALLFRRRTGLVIIAGTIVLLIAAAQILPPEITAIRFWGDPIVGEFLFGIALGLAFNRGVRFSRSAGAMLIAAGFLLAVGLFQADAYLTVWRLVTGGFPAALIVAGTALQRPRGTAPGPVGRWLILGGDASYALYLSHPLAVKPAAIVLGHVLDHGWGVALFFVVPVAAALVGSLIVHQLIERPLLAYMMAHFTRFGSTGYGDGQPVAPAGTAVGTARKGHA